VTEVHAEKEIALITGAECGLAARDRINLLNNAVLAFSPYATVRFTHKSGPGKSKKMRWFTHVVPAVVWFGIPSAMSLSIPPPQQILKSWSGTNNICPLAPKVEVPEDGLLSALRYVQDEAIRLQQVDRLSRAVQIPTTVNDYMTDPFDEGFAPFVDFQALLESLFPLMYAFLS
jgi:hypothetical protein